MPGGGGIESLGPGSGSRGSPVGVGQGPVRSGGGLAGQWWSPTLVGETRGSYASQLWSQQMEVLSMNNTKEAGCLFIFAPEDPRGRVLVLEQEDFAHFKRNDITVVVISLVFVLLF